MGHRVRVQGRGELGDHKGTSPNSPRVAESGWGGYSGGLGFVCIPEQSRETPPLGQRQGLRDGAVGSEASALLEGLGSSRRPSRKGDWDSWEPHRGPRFHFVPAGSLHPSLR